MRGRCNEREKRINTECFDSHYLVPLAADVSSFLASGYYRVEWLRNTMSVLTTDEGARMVL